MRIQGLDAEALVRRCMILAAETAAAGNPPFAAVLVDPAGRSVVESSNRQVTRADPTAHAEIELLRAAAGVGRLPPLTGYALAVNAEPCSMCASAIVKAAVAVLVFGAPHEHHMDPDLGVTDVFARARRPPRIVAGVLAAECQAQIAQLRAGMAAID